VPSRFSESRRRRRNARELERRMRELDRIDRLHGLGASPAIPVPRRSRRREGLSTVLTLLLTMSAVGAVVAFAPGEQMREVRQALGIAGGRPLPVPGLVDRGGTYAFTHTQGGSDQPVGYDPCVTVEVEINPEGAPDGYEDLVDTAIARIERASGLDLEVVGTTDMRPREHSARPPTRRPVLVAWATADEVPDLAGDVAGIGGSTAVTELGGRLSFVTGQVVLDADVYAAYGPGDRAYAQAIVDHEFGHLVGLAHVDDPYELMYADNNGATGWGPGDLEGLARLGRIGC